MTFKLDKLKEKELRNLVLENRRLAKLNKELSEQLTLQEEKKGKMKRLGKCVGMTGKIYKMLMRRAEGPSYISARLRISMCLLTITGIRLNQLITLKVSRIEPLFKEGWVLTDRVKPGPGSHKAFLNMEGKKLLRERQEDFEFLCLRKRSDSYIFTNEYDHSKPLTPETITKAINLVLREVSEEIPSKPYLNSYSFRTGYIKELWKDSRDIEFVKQSVTGDKLDSNFEKVKSL